MCEFTGTIVFEALWYEIKNFSSSLATYRKINFFLLTIEHVSLYPSKNEKIMANVQRFVECNNMGMWLEESSYRYARDGHRS